MATLSQSFLGRYRLLAPIRTGRYTQVWAAIDDTEQRYVCVKMLLPEYRKDSEQISTMRHELRVGRLLAHPGCLGAFDIRRSSQGTYLLMDLFQGDNLRDVAKRRPEFIRRRFASFARQGAEAVAHLNALGYVHLDVKPDNFMVNDAGEVRLIDFALAKHPARNVWERTFWKQRQTKIQGTRSYMSPEQIRREPLDPRSDVYSFGCHLYHLATGAPPYTAASSDELLMKHLHAPLPRLLVDCPDATPEFDELMRAMLAKRPQQRPHSLGELLPELARLKFFKSEPAAAAAPAAPPPQRRKNVG